MSATSVPVTVRVTYGPPEVDPHDQALDALAQLRESLQQLELRVPDHSRPTLLSMFDRELQFIEATVHQHREAETARAG